MSISKIVKAATSKKKETVNDLNFLNDLSKKDKLANNGFDMPPENSPTVKAADEEQQRFVREKALGEGYAVIGDMPAMAGAPSSPNIPGIGDTYVGQSSDIKNSAAEYTANAGIPFREPQVYTKVDEVFAGRVAEEYDYMKHNPADPRVKKSYEALIKETEAQYEQMLKDGVKPFFIRGENPYANSPYAALKDISENKRIGVFPTSEGYGAGNESWDVFDPKQNPLAGESKYLIDGQPATFNDLFRAVHDYYGHAKTGVGFRASGEEMAYKSHSGMYSPLAMRAAAVETRGQNSWLNYGPYGPDNRQAQFDTTVFADQKTGLLPNWAAVEKTPLGEVRSNYVERTGPGSLVDQLAGAVDDDGIVTLNHYSPSALDRVNPENYGKGLSSKTVSEINLSSHNDFAKRSFYGVNTKTNPYRREQGLGQSRNVVHIPASQIYDIKNDPDNLFAQIPARTPFNGRRSQQERYNELSNLIDENGYSAMLQDTEMGKVVAVFDTLKTSKQGGFADMKLVYAIPAAAFGISQVVTNNKQHIVEALAAAGGFSMFSSDADAGPISKAGKTVIDAWHGTPHDFDKFSTDYIGSGEGAQAYGWGIYLADRKAVGQGYREKLSDMTHLNGYDVNGVTYQRGTPEFKALGILNDEGEIGAAKLLEEYKEDLADGEAYILDMGGQDFIDKYTDTLAMAREIDPAEVQPQMGNLYNVEIDAEPDQMLDWDLPLAEQSDYVQEALASVGVDISAKEGRKLYYTIQPDATNPKEASKYLQNIGIKGIQFADGQSRNKPVKQIAAKWRTILADDAGPEEVRELLDEGVVFDAKQTELLEALEADDYLGYDYPALAVEEALTGNLGEYDPSKRLMRAVAASRQMGSKNYVVFDEKAITIRSKNGQIVGGTSATAAAVVASNQSFGANLEHNMLQDSVEQHQANVDRATGTLETIDPKLEHEKLLLEQDQMMMQAGPGMMPGVTLDAIAAIPGIFGQGLAGVAEVVQNIDSSIDSFDNFLGQGIFKLGEGVENSEFMAGLKLVESGELTNEEFNTFADTGVLPEGVEIDTKSTPAKAAYILEAALGQPENPAEEVAKIGTQFMLPFTQFSKGLKAMGWTAEKGMSAFARNLTAEAIVANVAFDPFEDQFGNLLKDLGVENEFIEWITTKDGEAEARLKTTLDVVGTAAAIEGGVKAVSAAATSNASKKIFRSMLNSKPGKALLIGAGSIYAARKGFKEQTGKEVAEQAVDLQQLKFDKLKASSGDPDADIYNMGAKNIDEVEINFSRINADDDIKDIIQDLADADISEINAARRGKVGWDQTNMEADKLNAFQVLADRRKGEPLNAAQTVAVRNLWAQSGAKANELAEAVQLDPSPVNMIAYKRQLVIHSAIQREVLGARAETARALNAWKMPANANDLTVLTDQLKDEDSILAIAERHVALTEAGTVEQVEAFVNGSAWAKTKDAVAQAWYFSLLSGPKTHGRNFFGNTLTTMMRPAELALAARMPGASQVRKGEASAALYGMMVGTIRGLRVSKETGKMGTVWQSVKANQSGFGVGKVDQPMITGFDPERWNLMPGSPMYNATAVVNGTLSVPGRALTASDELFKTMNFDMEINRLVFKEVDEMIEKGEIPESARQHQMDEMIRNPEDYMTLKAQAMAQRQTFTDVPETTKVNNMWNSISHLPVLGKIIQPFRNTPYNIGLYTFERTPLAPVVKRYRDAINAGGEAKEMAVAQQAFGTSIMMIGADLTMSGAITGNGPSNKEERKKWLLTHKPYSVRWQDPDTGAWRHVSYRGLEPIGGLLSTMATVTEILQATENGEEASPDIKEMVTATTIAIANAMTVQSYMSGTADFLEMMNEPDIYADQYFNRLLSTLTVPSAVNEITKNQDPVMRYAASYVDSVCARTPGCSAKLPASYDRWGNERTRRSELGPLYDSVSPFYVADIKPQPIDVELERIQKWVGMPGAQQSFAKPYGQGSISVKLKKDYPAAYFRMVQLAGNEITKNQYGAPITATGFVSQGGTMQEELNNLVTNNHPMSSMYNMLTDGEDGGKAAMIQSIMNAYRKAAKHQVMKEYPDLEAEVNSRAKTPKYKFQEGM